MRYANALPAIDGPACVACIRDVTIPEIDPGSAVVLDNLATHRNKEAEALMTAGWCFCRPTART